jgi:hypothetical protein
MAELCTAFKRIVPRYQFSTNQAAFTIEDMRDAPIKKRNGGDCFRGPMCGRNPGYNLGENAHYASPYGFSVRPKVCRKCHPRYSNRVHPEASQCSSMDTCGNWQAKARMYHDM